MINRILIRIKVIQMLYSFMLTRSDFHIDPIPEKRTRDTRFAYATYINTLLLILKLSGYKTTPKDQLPNLNTKSVAPALAASKLAASLATNSELQEYVSRTGASIDSFADQLERVLNLIAASAVYNDYARKRKKGLEEDVTMWCALLDTVISRDAEFVQAARRSEDFTIAGFERGIAMVIATLRNFNDVKATLVNTRRSLRESLDQAYSLYVALLMLPAEITRMRADQIENAKDKYLPTNDDLNPNLKFINNSLVDAISHSEAIEEALKERPFSWEPDYYLIKSLLDKVLESDIYKAYMAEPTQSFQDDCDLWRDLLKDIILPSDELSEALEGRSVYWNDDIAIVGTFVLKSIRRASNDKENRLELLPMYKDEVDAAFAEELFTYAVDNIEQYRGLVDRFVNEAQWDTERIALMDIVILTAAIAEILNFPSIPVPVTLNEYIEIANYYSSPRSGQFINGILFSVINYLRDEGRLNKPFENK